MYVAQENTYHPVRNYLQHCEQNVTPIDISQLATKYLGTNHWLYDRFVMRFLVACVARVMNPGCKVDDVLILQGEQGIGKTSFFELLGGQWFDGSMGDGSDKDDFLKLHQSWIQEWGELDRITGRKQVGEIKHFLSLSKDTFREPYGRTTDEYPRHTVIVGSVNDAQFLNDPTGDRRFWVIPVPQNIDTETVKRDRDALWAEAVRLYRSGEQWWLTDEEKTASSDNNEQFRLSDDWETIIENYLKRDGEPKSVSDIAENCFNLQPNELDKNTQIRIGKICRKLGAESKRIRHGKSKITAYQLEPTEQELEEMEKKAGMK
jgi:predicted P-loop ATPase